MITNILAFGTPGAIEILIILIVLSVLALLIIFLVRYILRNKRENIMLRLEVGKLADELEQTRKKKDVENNSSSDKSS